MKKILQNWLKKLYFRYCDPDIVAVTRLQLRGVGANTNLEEMSAQKRQGYLKEAKALSQNRVLKDIINTIIHEQINFSITRANTWEESCFGRFSINGASLVQERLQLLASEFDAENQPKTITDPHAIL